MFGDVERLKVILSDLGETISQPNTLPVAAKEFVEVGDKLWVVSGCGLCQSCAIHTVMF